MLLLALSCSGSSTTPPGEPVTQAPSAPRTFVLPTVPTAVPEPGTTVLHPPVSGAGKGRIGPLDVPERYEVVVVCAGSGLRIESPGAGTHELRCEPRRTVLRLLRPVRPMRVTLSVTGHDDTQWSIVVTTPSAP